MQPYQVVANDGQATVKCRYSSYVNCQASMSEDGLSVSLSGLKGDDTDMYRCVVEVIYPPPYMKRVGNGTLVYVPGER